MKRITFLFSILSVFVLLACHAQGASKIVQVDFENSVSDIYNNAVFDDLAPSPEFVDGYDGKAIRTSHNGPDSGTGSSTESDFRVSVFLPETKEIYVSGYIKYESNYDYMCDGVNDSNVLDDTPINNVKWDWLDCTEDGFRGHWEFIWQYNDSSLNLYPSNNSSWGTVGGSPVKSATITSPIGRWTHVEQYWKESTGIGHQNTDGKVKIWIDGVSKYDYDGIVTGPIDYIFFPSIKATCYPDGGYGWWQLDKWEAWDGLPSADATPPVAPVGLTIS